LLVRFTGVPKKNKQRKSVLQDNSTSWQFVAQVGYGIIIIGDRAKEADKSLRQFFSKFIGLEMRGSIS
jgi:hypothetical protein